MPDSISVPDVVGLTRPAAETQLKNIGLGVGVVTTVGSPTVPLNSVSSSNPPAGTLVNSGSTVNLEVSSGPAQVAVPDVVGLTRPAAEIQLKNVGLVAGAVKTQHSDSIPDGGISNTNPPAGTLVSPGSKVGLELSNGPEPNWAQYIPTLLFSLLGVLLLGGVAFIFSSSGQKVLDDLSDKDVARGLITFLIAIATVGIAIILAISTLLLTEGDAGDKRFDRGKQVLSILIGVLGTIVGFYFGSAPDSQKAPVAQISTSTLPDGTVNKSYTPTTLQTTGLIQPLRWSLMPTLPDGLMFDAVAGTITGTPQKTFTKTLFTFTVTDSAMPPVTKTANLELEIK